MTTKELEHRVETLETLVRELRDEVRQRPADSKRGILSMVGAFADDPEFDDVVAHGKYFRATGRTAPPEWKPGDPIPEPEFDE